MLLEKLSLQKISLLLFVLSAFLFAENSGGQGNGIMRGPIGAEAWGRGGAYTANANNSHALWNPALSANLKRPQLSIGSEFRSLGRFGTYVSGEAPIKRRNIGYSYLFAYRGIPGLDSLRDGEGELLEDGSYTAILLKAGLSVKLGRTFSLGLALGFSYDKFPIDFDPSSKKLEYGKSKEFAGISLLSSWQAKENLLFSFGVRDMLFLQDWTTYNQNSLATVITDTLPLDIVLATSYRFEKAGQQFQLDADLDAYLVNAFFSRLKSPYGTIKLGMSWQPIYFARFRVGVRDLLLSGSLRDFEKYKREANPRYSAGFGFASKKIIKIAETEINYAVTNSGANAGLDHALDFVLLF